MNKKNNYNSIVFLTTLSVYLGLVLVAGAVPSALAQDLKSSPISKEASFLAGNQIITINAKWAVDFEKILSKNFTSTHLIGEFAFPVKENSVWKIIKFEGNSEAIKFLEKRFLTLPVVSPPNLEMTFPLPSIQKLFFELTADKDNIKLTQAIAYKKSADADEFNFYYQNILSNREKIKDKIGKAEKIYLENTTSGLSNNQVFIVTRLPRASLDALLAEKDAK